MKNNFTPLKINNLKVLKIIRVQDNMPWNPFSGNLYYTRELTSDYNSSTTDFIDSAILDAIAKVFPDSRLMINRNIVYEGLIDDILQSYPGEEDKEFKITFITDVPFDQFQNIDRLKICNPTLIFKFRRTSLNDPKKLEIVNTHIQAEIPYEKAAEFCTKYKLIDKL